MIFASLIRSITDYAADATWRKASKKEIRINAVLL